MKLGPAAGLNYKIRPGQALTSTKGYGGAVSVCTLMRKRFLPLPGC